jgi:hypothetical protein
VRFRVKVAPGAGVLGRFNASLVLAPADSPILDAVLDLAREAEREHAVAPGRFLSRKVAGLLSQTDDTPTLALVSTVDDGLAVLLVGDATMRLTTATGTSVVSGHDATTWVDQIVRGEWSSLLLSLAGAGDIDVRSDLQGGVVAAGGAQLLPMDAPVAAPPVAPLGAAFESFSLSEPAESEPVPPEPLPVAEPVSRATEELTSLLGTGGVTVQGIACSRQHFNDPTAIYCSVCGISMVHQTHNLVIGVRPPLGVIVLDDGAVFTLAGDYVLGREPDAAVEVTSGTATPLMLDDPEVTMSRVHAKLLLVGWEVQLVDAGSANGTYVAKPGETDWTRLPSLGSVVLKPGTKVSLGGRTLLFDSHHKL